ncbi:hypothetical protein [Nocardia otitidiscaviarum]|uniref:hypothetical protein n=1 Tax=Nocardia otitidiscaviarum TaxID=1823 RepID=UPI0004A6C414|nr:hypothetical protein [Nocardia otitidiscaviarum]
MTPEEIRAEAIERIARAEYTSWLERVRTKAAEWGEKCEHLPWNEAPDEGEWGRDRWRRAHVANVDALGDMLPTVIEQRVHPCDCQPCPECEAAALADGATRQQRYVTAWQEMTE